MSESKRPRQGGSGPDRRRGRPDQRPRRAPAKPYRPRAPDGVGSAQASGDAPPRRPPARRRAGPDRGPEDLRRSADPRRHQRQGPRQAGPSGAAVVAGEARRAGLAPPRDGRPADAGRPGDRVPARAGRPGPRLPQRPDPRSLRRDRLCGRQVRRGAVGVPRRTADERPAVLRADDGRLRTRPGPSGEGARLRHARDSARISTTPARSSCPSSSPAPGATSGRSRPHSACSRPSRCTASRAPSGSPACATPTPTRCSTPAGARTPSSGSTAWSPSTATRPRTPRSGSRRWPDDPQADGRHSAVNTGTTDAGSTADVRWQGRGMSPDTSTAPPDHPSRTASTSSASAAACPPTPEARMLPSGDEVVSFRLIVPRSAAAQTTVQATRRHDRVLRVDGPAATFRPAAGGRRRGDRHRRAAPPLHPRRERPDELGQRRPGDLRADRRTRRWPRTDR